MLLVLIEFRKEPGEYPGTREGILIPGNKLHRSLSDG